MTSRHTRDEANAIHPAAIAVVQVEDSAWTDVGNNYRMLTILLIVLVVMVLFGGISGPRYYRGRAARRTVVREYDTEI